MTEPEAKAASKAADRPSSPSISSQKSSSSSGSGSSGNRFFSIFQSVQKNIETLNYVTKEIEKINDRFLFHSATITTAEESTLLNKVSHLHKDTSMKARDTSRMIQHMRLESTKPTTTTSTDSEGKAPENKTPEELAEESRDLG